MAQEANVVCVCSVSSLFRESEDLFFTADILNCFSCQVKMSDVQKVLELI